MKSFKIGIKTKNDPTWVFNALRFGSREAAEQYASSLSLRWTAVTSFIIEESDDKPNTTYPVLSDRYPTKRKDQ